MSAATVEGARLAGVPERTRNPVVRISYWLARRRFGRVPAPLKVTAHHPLLMSSYGGLELALEKSSKADPKLKELVQMKAAMLAGCEWCIDIGAMLLRHAGVTEEQIRDLHRYRESEHFSEEEKLVLDLAAGITRTPVDVSDELMARLRERFTEAQLVELVAATAIENYRARFNWTFGIASEGFSEGTYCPVPEAPAEESAAA